MSGDYFEGAGFRIKEDLVGIAEDELFRQRFPNLSNLLIALGEELAQIEHQVDYDLSGYEKLPLADKTMERVFIGNILSACVKNAPSE